MNDDYVSALEYAVELLKKSDRVLILSHMSPDGDTLGSAYALCRALQQTGKLARVECSDELPVKYSYLYGDIGVDDFEPELIVSSDIASSNLLGNKLEKYADKIALCIDHHPSNSLSAGFRLLNTQAAATCEIMYDVLEKMGAQIDKNIANCIYTGLSTDTGCFRYSNTTPHTLRKAAHMIEMGADAAVINKRMFETVSKERLEAETQALLTLEYHFDGRAALMTVSREMCKRTGIGDADLEGFPAIPARIEGVLAGVTLKEKDDGVYKISVRTNGLNASDICAEFGGGGHFGAAGCAINAGLQEVKDAMLAAVKRALDKA